jgi:light-regulated signal transduction histidine kinase (bacteriophytochrome)
MLAFFVGDSGAGFEMKHADRFWGPFQRLQAESEFEGSGIGLDIVRPIIQRHGGPIWAEPDGGAAFDFTLESTE